MSDKQANVFIADSNTHKRIREHFSDATDIISEEDIKNAVTNFHTVVDQADIKESQLQEG